MSEWGLILQGMAILFLATGAILQTRHTSKLEERIEMLEIRRFYDDGRSH